MAAPQPVVSSIVLPNQSAVGSSVNPASVPSIVSSSNLPSSVTVMPTATISNSVAETKVPTKVLDKRRLQELVKEVDPLEQLDEDVEEVMMQIADDFIDSVVTSSCQLAKHRKSNTVEVKDVLLHLERNWNMWIPGYRSGDDAMRNMKKAPTTEAHKQRMALIKKTLKKY